MSDTLGPVEVAFVIPPDFGLQADAAIKKMAGLTDAATQMPKMAGDAVKDFAQQSSAAMKASINEQKQLIKSIGQDIKDLQKQAEGTQGKQKLDLVGDVRAAKRALEEEKATLKGMQKQQVDVNNQERESQGGLISSLGKWAVGIFSVTAAMKIGKDIINSTEGTAHRLEQTMEATSSGLNYFFKSLASGDFSNFWSGIERSIQGARDFVDAMEDIENKRNEQNVKSSKFDIKIGENRQDSYSTDPKVVKQALKNIIALQTEKLTEEADLAKQEYQVKLKKIATDNNLTKEQVETIATHYSSISKVIEKGEKYIKEKAKSSGGSFLLTGGAADAKKAAAEIDKAGEAAAKIATLYGKVPMDSRAEISGLLKKAGEAEAAININNRRDKQRLVNIEKQEQDKELSDAKKFADEKNRQTKATLDYDTEIGRQRITNQLEIDQQTLNLQQDSAEKERQQAELDFKKTLVTIANQKAEQLKKLNEVSGGTDKETGKPTANYVSALPETDQKQIDAKLILAEKTRAAKIVEINDKEGEKLKEIWRDINDSRLSGLEKARASINEKYDKMAADAKGNADLLKAIEGERLKATTVFNIKTAVEDAGFEEKIASQKAELTITGFDREDRLLKKLFEIHVMYQQLAIDRLKTSPDIKDQQQAQVMQGDLDIDKQNNAVGTQAGKWKDIVSIMGTLQQASSGLNNQFSDTVGIIADMAIGLAGAVAQLKEGGNQAGAIGTIAQMWLKLGNLVDAEFGEQHRLLEIEDKRLKSNIKLQMVTENMNSALADQRDILDSINDIGKYAEFEKSIAMEQDKIKKLTQAVDDYQMAFMHGTISIDLEALGGDLALAKEKVQQLFSSGAINEEDYNAMMAYFQGIKDGEKEVIALEKERLELATQTNAVELGNQLMDTIVNAYAQGEDAALAWGKVADQVMANAIKNAIKMMIVMPAIEAAVAQVNKDMLGDSNGDGKPDYTLTPEQRQNFRDAVNAPFAMVDATMKQFPDLFGADAAPGGSSSTASKNSFSTMKQETGDQLLGQFTALRMSSAAIADILRDERTARASMKQSLQEIADNTYYCRRLENIDNTLKAMETDGIKVR